MSVVNPFFFPPLKYVEDIETDIRMNKILSKHFMDPADVVVKKDEPEVL
jgi:hypothetical protein